MTTKTVIEIAGGIVGILVGAIAIYQFVYSGKPSLEIDAARQARLIDIANLVRDVTGVQSVQLPNNYEIPIVLLLHRAHNETQGVNHGESNNNMLILDKPGSMLVLMELQTALHDKYGKEIFADSNTSIHSIYTDLYDN